MEHRRTALVCTESSGPILSLADGKKQLRVESDDDDDLITGYIATASAHLDGADGILKRALLNQSWTLVLPGFRPHEGFTEFWNIVWSGYGDAFRGHHRDRRILLPLPPAQSVEAVRYIDVSGAPQILDPSAWRLVACGTEPSFILPAIGQSWPSAIMQPDAVKIDFTAGYGADMTDVPPALVAAVKLHLGLLYENREAALVADRAAAVLLPKGYEDLIYNYRMLRAA